MLSQHQARGTQPFPILPVSRLPCPAWPWAVCAREGGTSSLFSPWHPEEACTHMTTMAPPSAKHTPPADSRGPPRIRSSPDSVLPGLRRWLRCTEQSTKAPQRSRRQSQTPGRRRASPHGPGCRFQLRARPCVGGPGGHPCALPCSVTAPILTSAPRDCALTYTVSLDPGLMLQAASAPTERRWPPRLRSARSPLSLPQPWRPVGPLSRSPSSCCPGRGPPTLTLRQG